MKLFEENIEEALDYLRHAVINDEMELELVMGASPWQTKKLITKSVFMRVLEECRNTVTYDEIPEMIDLDITQQLYSQGTRPKATMWDRRNENQKTTDIRATIHGIDAIKKYCKDGDLRKLNEMDKVGPLPAGKRAGWQGSVEFIIKQSVGKRPYNRNDRTRDIEREVKKMEKAKREGHELEPPAWLYPAMRAAEEKGPIKDMEKRNIIDDDYNVRLKLRTEHYLFNEGGADGVAEEVGTRGSVRKFLFKYEDKMKHYRYKKRFSFLTEDKLFRIDLTIIKSTKTTKIPNGSGRPLYIQNFQPSFKEANILSQPEDYEIEIEYVGARTRIPSRQDWRTQKEATHKMISPINELYADHLDGKKDYYPQIKAKGDTYDPLAIGINTDLFEEQSDGDSTDEGYPENIFDSPRYDGDENPTLFMNTKLSEDATTKRYSYDEYHNLIGKSTMIKREYFVEHGIDMKVFNTLMEYSKRNIFHAKISDITEEIDEKTNEFIEVRATISLYPAIGSVRFLHVPLEYLVGGSVFSITEDKISFLHSKTERPAPLVEYEGRGAPGLFFPAHAHTDDEWTALERERELEQGAWKEKLKQGDDDPNLEKLLETIFHTLEKTVIHLSLTIYDTDVLIPQKQKQDIIKEYRKLTKQKEKGKFKFVGPQPVSINKNVLDINNPGTILVDYAVTEKADGERYELFIINGSGYFINQKEEVIDSGCSFGNIEGKWILDGEYITKDKNNEPIRLFMIFDVYWCDLNVTASRSALGVGGKNSKHIDVSGIPIEAHTLPFITRDPMDKRSREYILKWFMENAKITTKVLVGVGIPVLPAWAPRATVSRHKARFSTEIRLKTYEFGYQSKSKEETRDAKEIGKYAKIFDAAANILRKDKAGEYEYRIDGLIYLPTRLSIRGKGENVKSSIISGTWDYNYKWKPPEENTIDFKVKVETELNKGQIKEIIRNYSDHKDGTRKKEEYKSVELLVGYNENQDTNTTFCMKILKNNDALRNKKDSELQKFNIHSDEDEKYNETNIKLVNGKMLCDNDEKSEIIDGDFVEMRFNPKAENGMFWEPIRVRKDKTKPQFFNVANNIWKTINDPITEEMITGSAREGGIIGGDEIISSGEYYIEGISDIVTASEPLRKFHNHIKSMLISGICSSFNKPIKVMDLSIGRGGDLSKYLETKNVSFLFGIDISSNVNEACKRFYNDRNKGSCKTVIVRGNTSKNIQNLEFSDVKESTKEDKEHCDIMTNIVYGKQSPIPPGYVDIKKNYFGQARGGFDIISSQFSMHYYFESNSTFSGFIRNLKENTKKGGYFIGTCYDGRKIFDHFKQLELLEQKMKKEEEESPGDEEWEDDSSESSEEDPSRAAAVNTISHTGYDGNLVYQIDKKYDLDNFDYDESDNEKMFGNVIDVYMDSIGQTLPEYLVNFEFFVKVMKENGFEPVTNLSVKKKYSKLFKKDNFNNQKIGEFKNVIQEIKDIPGAWNAKDRKWPDKRDGTPGAQKRPFLFAQYMFGMQPNNEYEMENDKRFLDPANDMFSKTMVTPLERLSSFNNYFIFKKM